MKEADREQVMALYADALEQLAEERMAYVLKQAPTEEICADVLRLLRMADFETGFIRTGGGIEPGLVTLPAGTLIGNWRILDMLGQGGMGEIYHAERQDHFQQQAAVKLISSSVPAAWERFQQERQILADLEHPHIARLIDGGVHEDRRPYLVMEHVAGQTIIDYIQQERLPAKETLHLFLTLCEALGHAHERLVLHRDIKPANILVADQGHLKLIDFGVASLLTEDKPARRAPVTLAYAAPELVGGGAASIRSDIFSLGLTLAEMLSGRPPIVTGVSEARILMDDLDTELQAIIRKATATAPEARYASVALLKQDIGHYLQGEPVSAMPQTGTYRLKKFASRHKLPVLLGTGLGVALVAGLVSTSLMAVFAMRSSEQARIDAEISDERSVFAAATSQVYADITAQAVSAEENGDLDFKEILDGERAKAIVALESNPEDARNTLYALSKLHDLRGDVAALEAVVKPFYEAEDREGRATHMSLQRYAMIKARQGDLDTAFEAFGRAEKLMLLKPRIYAFDLANMRANRAGFSKDPALLQETAAQIRQAANDLVEDDGSLNDAVHLYSQAGFLYFQQGNLPEALATMEEAYRLNQTIEGTRGTSDEQLLYPQVIIYTRLEEYEKALEVNSRIITVAEEAYGPSVNLARRLEQQGEILGALERFPEAIPLLERAVTLYKTYDAQPSRGVATALELLAGQLRAAGQGQEALATYQRALNQYQALSADTAKLTELEELIARLENEAD